MTVKSREQQMADAEEILGERMQSSSFAKGLFFGEYAAERLPPYPAATGPHEVDQLVDSLTQFCHDSIDPVAIDRDAEIPRSVIAGLGKLGVLGACLPRESGGLGLSQTAYCRLLEVLGGHCGSTALFVNAHHSIGPRALVLFGTREQQQRYLPKLASGEWISAFALTEPNAGSDAANVQTTATPTADGKSFVLSGEKRWITNGGIADVLTVMARTPDASGKGKISAFVVTPEMAGFEVVEKRMEKLGVRGTATARLAFRNCVVPRENMLGPEGKGLKVALTVLDFGRVTFGASCTGAASFCIDRAVEHVQRRVQFDEPLARFELVQQKIAEMTAGHFAMEACTYQTAALIDHASDDFMLETAMLKVFATETLWKILGDTFQLHGGLAYFNDQPFERMLRDARINTIGEGANDVLRVFSALVGMRDVGLELEGVLQAVMHPMGRWSRIGRFAGRKLSQLVASPSVPVRHPELEAEATHLGNLVNRFGSEVEWLLRTYQTEIVDRQLHLSRVADAAIDLYASACVLRRMDYLITARSHGDSHDSGHTPEGRQKNGHHRAAQSLATQLAAGKYFLAQSRRKIKRLLAELHDQDDALTTDLASRMLPILGKLKS